MNSRVSGAILLCFAPFGALPSQEAALTIKPESVSAMGRNCRVRGFSPRAECELHMAILRDRRAIRRFAPMQRRYRVSRPSRRQEFLSVECDGGRFGGRRATVTVRQTALSEETFRYLSTLTDQTSSAFSPFAVPTANLRGNISNVTNPSHRALGFFRAGEVAEIRVRVP
jgi:Domain of unknown function (DUF4249)